MSILYIEPFSGISGDMFLGALCELTDSYAEIANLPESLTLPDGKVEIQQTNKNGIVCNHVKVIDLSSGHHHHEHGHGHRHRHLKDIYKIIEEGSISDKAKAIAKEIFLIIGRAESTIHNIPIEKIHFHEVSGVDSILDIVGCAVLLDKLEVEKAYSDPVCTGYGMVKTQHGLLPVPAPATADILRKIPTYKGDEEGEKVTPTGAAILKYLHPDFNPPLLTSQRIAYGPGSKDFKNPNVVRVSIVEPANKKPEEDQMFVVESNIDDSTAEYLGSDFQNSLIQNGATDFYITPIQMKKGRPGLKITVLVSPKNLKRVNEFIMENTSTIGVRYYPVSKDKLPRRSFEIDTKYGKIKVKEVTSPSGQKRQKIEYESLQELSKKNKISIQQLKAELFHPNFHS